MSLFGCKCDKCWGDYLNYLDWRSPYCGSEWRKNKIEQRIKAINEKLKKGEVYFDFSKIEKQAVADVSDVIAAMIKGRQGEPWQNELFSKMFGKHEKDRKENPAKDKEEFQIGDIVNHAGFGELEFQIVGKALDLFKAESNGPKRIKIFFDEKGCTSKMHSTPIVKIKCKAPRVKTATFYFAYSPKNHERFGYCNTKFYLDKEALDKQQRKFESFLGTKLKRASIELEIEE